MVCGVVGGLRQLTRERYLLCLAELVWHPDVRKHASTPYKRRRRLELTCTPAVPKAAVYEMGG